LLLGGATGLRLGDCCTLKWNEVDFDRRQIRRIPNKLRHRGNATPIKVGFHSLRHTYVSLQAERGIPQSTVQAIVGHGSPAMTVHYTHITDKAAEMATLPLGAKNAEFEALRDPLPAWAVELVEGMVGWVWPFRGSSWY
jgi:integrase